MSWLGRLKCLCPSEHKVDCNPPLVEKMGFVKDGPIFN